ncbi:hypothetical protein [Prosthecobacter sp.]|uniref:hypothetical protein n=1 Tax=Prosthecobacter sp. TaxID=1965333 RepID=UPI0037844B62
MTPEVHRAIEGLYAAFAGARRPASIVMSPVKDPEEFASLLTTPLRELTTEQLWQYSFSVFYTVGDATEFDYFLPRILELASEPFSPLQIEVVFQKPAMSGWPNGWSQERRRAFSAYLDAMVASWAVAVCEIDGWVCALSYCLADIDKRLDVLISGTDAANENLRAFHEANRESLLKDKLSNSFWKRETNAHRRIVAWLKRAEVEQRIVMLCAADWVNPAR